MNELECDELIGMEMLIKAMFTRAYLYRIHVCNTGTQYMLQLCLHVSTGIAYMYAHAYH